MSSHSRLHDQMVMKWLKPYIHLEYPQKIFYTKNMSTFEGKNDDCKILGRIKILTNRCIVTEFLVIIGTIQLLILSFTMMMYHFEEYPNMTISINIYSITSISVENWWSIYNLLNLLTIQNQSILYFHLGFNVIIVLVQR